MRGWRLVGITALGVGAMLALIFALHGPGEDWIHVGLRATARSSALLFLAAFLASALRRTWRNEATAWLLRNRRYLGVSFAVSHTWHLWLIVELARVTGEPYFTLTLVFGGLAYVFLALMVATSFDRTTRWLGRRRWNALHTTGVYYLWFIFTYTFFGSAAYNAFSATFFVLMAAALPARVVLKRQAAASAPGPG